MFCLKMTSRSKRSERRSGRNRRFGVHNRPNCGARGVLTVSLGFGTAKARCGPLWRCDASREYGRFIKNGGVIMAMGDDHTGKVRPSCINLIGPWWMHPCPLYPLRCSRDFGLRTLWLCAVTLCRCLGWPKNHEGHDRGDIRCGWQPKSYALQNP